MRTVSKAALRVHPPFDEDDGASVEEEGDASSDVLDSEEDAGGPEEGMAGR
jgi:hypothetical protein